MGPCTCCTHMGGCSGRHIKFPTLMVHLGKQCLSWTPCFLSKQSLLLSLSSQVFVPVAGSQAFIPYLLPPSAPHDDPHAPEPQTGQSQVSLNTQSAAWLALAHMSARSQISSWGKAGRDTVFICFWSKVSCIFHRGGTKISYCIFKFLILWSSKAGMHDIHTLYCQKYSLTHPNNWNQVFQSLPRPQVYKSKHLDMQTSSTNIYERMGCSQESGFGICQENGTCLTALCQV